MDDNITDPIEAIVARALRAKGYDYIHEFEGIDFLVKNTGVFIECKQFHSDRIARQTARVGNIIVIQGRDAALLFEKMLVGV